VTFRISLDSSIFISQLTDDVHADAVLAALTVLETMGAELTLPLLCYAELWTGVELLPEEDRPAAAETLDRVLRASRVLLVADNVVIAREAARAQAAYRQRGGRREVLIPDFVIGANAAYYAGRLLTTNPRDFFRAFPALEVLTLQSFLEQYAPAQPPHDGSE
jgi:predicted nucleic acid-binding protein